LFPNGTSNCTTNCGDGKIIDPETCDDGKIDDFGCDDTCQDSLKGFDCNESLNVGPDLISDCKEICGDNLIVGNETCDDGSDDGKGCKKGCKEGVNPLWNCN